jgi:hypothetical protein
MGKGLALQFKQKYPYMAEYYANCCRSKLMRPGGVWGWNAPDGHLIINAATKNDWHYPSKIEWIDLILLGLKTFGEIGTFQSLALPPLGCGNGQLPWNIVGPRIANALRDLPIDVHIHRHDGMEFYF